MGEVFGKIFASIIVILLIGALVGSGAFAWWVNGLLIFVLLAALIYIWTR